MSKKIWKKQYLKIQRNFCKIKKSLIKSITVQLSHFKYSKQNWLANYFKQVVYLYEIFIIFILMLNCSWSDSTIHSLHSLLTTFNKLQGNEIMNNCFILAHYQYGKIYRHPYILHHNSSIMFLHIYVQFMYV